MSLGLRDKRLQGWTGKGAAHPPAPAGASSRAARHPPASRSTAQPCAAPPGQGSCETGPSTLMTQLQVLGSSCKPGSFHPQLQGPPAAWQSYQGSQYPPQMATFGSTPDPQPLPQARGNSRGHSQFWHVGQGPQPYSRHLALHKKSPSSKSPCVATVAVCLGDIFEGEARQANMSESQGFTCTLFPRQSAWQR